MSNADNLSTSKKCRPAISGRHSVLSANEAVRNRLSRPHVLFPTVSIPISEMKDPRIHGMELQPSRS
jgi:hypothetical protein